MAQSAPWFGKVVRQSRQVAVCRAHQLKSIGADIDPVLLGATNPLASAPGTIRGDFAIIGYPCSTNFQQAAKMCLRMSAATSAAAPMPLRARRKRLLCCSTRWRFSDISRPSTTGFMRSRKVYRARLLRKMTTMKRKEIDSN